MSFPTFSASLQMSGEEPFYVEQPLTALTGHPYMIGPAVAAVFNKRGSGKVVYVQEFNAKPLTTANSTVALQVLQRISALSGGDVVTAFPIDGQTSTLPSQVACAVFPVSVTVTGSTALRRTMQQPQLSVTAALAAYVARTTGDSRTGNDSSEFYNHPTDADAQPLVIRAGEGLVLTNVGSHPVHTLAVAMLVKDVTNARTYRFNAIVDPRGGNAAHIFALLNGAGSGVTLELHRMQIREVGTTDAPIVTWEPIEGVDEAGADLPTVAHSATALPAGILVKEDVTIVKAGYRVGAPLTIPYWRRAHLSEPPFEAGLAGLQFGRRGRFGKDVLNNNAARAVLREGQGFALVRRTASAQVCHEVQLLFTVADAIPAVGDVRSGTVYGQDQELVGTMSAGGGGATYSRGRVVNG